jgi:hypothetical protein
MNMHINTLQEQHDSWKAARERLFGTKKAPSTAKPVQLVELPPPEPVKKPLWQAIEIEFDDHVGVWRGVVRKCLETLAVSMSGRKIHPGVDPFKRNPKLIVAEVLEHFPGVTARELEGLRGPNETCLARQIAMYEVKMQRPELSLAKIGRLFGDRDHSTVYHAIQKITEMVEAGIQVYPIKEHI